MFIIRDPLLFTIDDNTWLEHIKSILSKIGCQGTWLRESFDIILQMVVDLMSTDSTLLASSEFLPNKIILGQSWVCHYSVEHVESCKFSQTREKVYKRGFRQIFYKIALYSLRQIKARAKPVCTMRKFSKHFHCTLCVYS